MQQENFHQSSLKDEVNKNAYENLEKQKKKDVSSKTDDAEGTKQDIYEYVTSVPEDGIAPFGITYAVFGNMGNTIKAATYSFKDGNNH